MAQKPLSNSDILMTLDDAVDIYLLDMVVLGCLRSTIPFHKAIQPHVLQYDRDNQWNGIDRKVTCSNPMLTPSEIEGQ